MIEPIEWIDIKAQLPEFGVRVLVASADGVGVAKRVNSSHDWWEQVNSTTKKLMHTEDWYWDDYDLETVAYAATHWAPLPTGPRAEGPENDSMAARYKRANAAQS